MRSAKEAVAYMKKIHTLVRYLGICDGNMQEGSFRCDANVSVRPCRQRSARHAHRNQEPQLFRFVERAILFEVERQIEVLESGGRSPGNAAVRSRPRRDALDAQQGRGQRLPLLPRSRPAAGGHRRRLHRGCAAGMPELPDAKRARFAALLTAWTRTMPRC
jgi:aspartyl-tRNA(Asn)/glutamyl-tRNA(Gln) amidotransferase subunit B